MNLPKTPDSVTERLQFRAAPLPATARSADMNAVLGDLLRSPYVHERFSARRWSHEQILSFAQKENLRLVEKKQSPAAYAYLESLMARLWETFLLHPSASAFQGKPPPPLHLIHDTEPNAFVMTESAPGLDSIPEAIFVTTGLLTAREGMVIEDDAQLAHVLAHELAHLYRAHDSEFERIVRFKYAERTHEPLLEQRRRSELAAFNDLAATYFWFGLDSTQDFTSLFTQLAAVDLTKAQQETLCPENNPTLSSSLFGAENFVQHMEVYGPGWERLSASLNSLEERELHAWEKKVERVEDALRQAGKEFYARLPNCAVPGFVRRLRTWFARPEFSRFATEANRQAILNGIDEHQPVRDVLQRLHANLRQVQERIQHEITQGRVQSIETEADALASLVVYRAGFVPSVPYECTREEKGSSFDSLEPAALPLAELSGNPNDTLRLFAQTLDVHPSDCYRQESTGLQLGVLQRNIGRSPEITRYALPLTKGQKKSRGRFLVTSSALKLAKAEVRLFEQKQTVRASHR